MLEAPLALIVGAMHALPTGSSSKFCSSYIIGARTNMVEAIDNFKTNQTLSGYTSSYNAIAYTDTIGAACFNAFSNELSVAHVKSLFDPWYTIPLNVVYNLGNMWVNFINLKFYTP